MDELLTAVCWPPAKFIVQKPRTFCRPAGDRVLVETVLFNATQNARLHGGDAPVQVSAAFSCHDDDCDLRLEVINVAGRNHAQFRALRVQDLLAADVDFASLGMGTAESTFLGLRDITLAAKAMEPPASVELRVEEDCVRFVMVCTLKVASDEEPPSRGVKRSRDLPDGLCYVVLDDDKITRLLARKQIAKFGPHPSSIVLGESRQEALSVPERVRTLAHDLGEENVIVILDQNLNYPDGDVLGTDLADSRRTPTAARSSSSRRTPSPFTYADAGADGTATRSSSQSANAEPSDRTPTPAPTARRGPAASRGARVWPCARAVAARASFMPAGAATAPRCRVSRAPPILSFGCARTHPTMVVVRPSATVEGSGRPGCRGRRSAGLFECVPLGSDLPWKPRERRRRWRL